MLEAGRRPWTASPLASALALAALALAAAVSPAQAQVAGPNVNMVSGTGWPGGDPFLQRQNEPSLAVSTRNPAHLLAGANDYRSVDLPGLPVGETGDAWLGLFKSFDGGLTWQSTLLPGYPQDRSPDGLASPLKPFTAAADAVVRAGTDGLFYYSGITFNRGSNQGQVFVSRFIDLNNKENGDATQSKDPIRYLDAAVIDSGTSGQFLDKPWLAVDVPRGAATCTVSVAGTTQTVGAGVVYMAYAKFTGTNSSSSQVMFARSLDCGRTWSKPLKISPNDHKNQGTNVAVDPATGTVYVTYRRFSTNSNNPDAMVVVASTDFGQTFTAGVDAATITPFDQFTTPTQFRTATLPALAVSVDAAGVSRVHLAWAQRPAAAADARIVVSTSRDGSTWSTPVPVDGAALKDDNGASFTAGHQFMPSLTFGEGRLMVLYYDQRLDQTLGRYTPNAGTTAGEFFVPDPVTGSFYKERRSFLGQATAFGPTIDESTVTQIRHLLELRVAEALPADNLAFSSSRVSRFDFGSNPYTNFADVDKTEELEQLEVNPPNLPLFKQGTLPFIGDYIEVSGLSFVPAAGGGWRFNTGFKAASTFHAVWTSNQDVVPPPDGDWTKYNPPPLQGQLSSIFDPTQPAPSCVTGFEGTRNQNIYASRISEGLLVYSPQNAKPLDVARAFVVIAQNTSAFPRAFRFTLGGAAASFQNKDASGQPVTTTTIDVAIPARSSIARAVFAQPSPGSPAATITVGAAELDASGGCTLASGTGQASCAPLSGGLQSTLLLNPPGALSGSLTQPDGTTAPISTSEVYTPTLSSAAVTSPNLAAVTSAAVTSAAVTSAAVTSAAVTSAAVTSTHLAVPQLAAVTSAAVTSAAVTSNNLSDASVTSSPLAAVTSGNIMASVTSAAVTSYPLSDANYQLTNSGNTTHSYHVKLVGTAPTCGTGPCPIQLILSKPYGSPFAVNCQLGLSYQPTIVANIDDVSGDITTNAADVQNPDIPDPRSTNATITLAPGESGVITIRGPLVLSDMQNAAGSLVPAVVPHAGGSYAAPLLITGNGTGLPVLKVGEPYTASLTGALGAIGGTRPYTWAVIAGALPPGLTLAADGTVTGTPQQAGNTTVTVGLTDAANAKAQAGVTFSAIQGGSTTKLTSSTASSVFGGPVTLTATLGATATGGSAAPGGSVTFLDGSTTIGTATVSGAAGQSTAAITVTSLAAGAHNLTASYSGDANYGPSVSAAVAVSVAQAVPAISVTGGTYGYDTAAHPATATVSGLGGANVAGLLTVTYAPGGTLPPLDAGSYAVTASFRSDDPNYQLDTSATGTVRVNPALPLVTVAGGAFAYDGQPHAATATVTGVGGAAVAGTTGFSYTPGGATPPVAAGTYPVVASFTSASANYTNATGNGSLTIGATAPLVRVAGGPFVYDARPHAATATATGLGGAAVAGSFSFSYNGSATAPTAAGSYAVVASFTSSDTNYGNATGSGTLVVSKATPTVTVTGGTYVYDGAAHPAAATAAGVGGAVVAGGFSLTYTPGGASAPVAAGSYAVAAAFSSSDPNYGNAVGAGSLVVNRANTTTTVGSSLATAWAGNQVTFTASVAPASALAPGAVAPGGTVTFKDGTTTLGTGTLGAGGTATFATSTLTAGTHSITALYAGDATFNGSTSSALTETVKPPYTFIGFASPLATAGTLSSPSSSGTWSYSRVVPVKWQLLDAKGANVTALSSTKLLSAWFAGATCPGTSPVGSTLPNTIILYVPTSGAAGGSTFRSGSTGFIFNWDATKASKGPGCYWIRLQLEDGSPEKVTTVLLN